MTANLIEAIRQRDLEAVKGLLDIKWDRIKWKRLEAAWSGPTQGLYPFEESFKMCVDPTLMSKKKKECKISSEICCFVLENLLCVYGADKNAFWSYLFSHQPFVQFGRHPIWVNIVEICCQHGLSLTGPHAANVLNFLASTNDVDVLKVLLQSGSPSVTVPMLELCSRYRSCGSEFFRVLLQHRVPDLWTTDYSVAHGRRVVDFMLYNLAASSDVDLLRSFIQHGMPPTNHTLLFNLSFAHNECSKDFFDLLLEHASPESNLHFFPLSYLVHHHEDHMAPGQEYSIRHEFFQILRDHPTNQLKSWAKRMHPGHTLRGDECSLCYDVYKSGQKIVKLPCGHVFHLECMLNCVPMKQDTCPYCRTRYI